MKSCWPEFTLICQSGRPKWHQILSMGLFPVYHLRNLDWILTHDFNKCGENLEVKKIFFSACKKQNLYTIWGSKKNFCLAWLPSCMYTQCYYCWPLQLRNFWVVSFYEFYVRFTKTMVFVYLEDVLYSLHWATFGLSHSLVDDQKLHWKTLKFSSECPYNLAFRAKWRNGSLVSINHVHCTKNLFHFLSVIAHE